MEHIYQINVTNNTKNISLQLFLKVDKIMGKKVGLYVIYFNKKGYDFVLEFIREVWHQAVCQIWDELVALVFRDEKNTI